MDLIEGFGLEWWLLSSAHSMHTPIIVEPQLAAACPKCGTHRTRIVGQSGEPPVVYRRCEVCEHVFVHPRRDPPSANRVT
jgi:hypothetical protein